MINSKWFNIIFRILGLFVILIGFILNYWYLKLAFLPFLYIIILSVRNNYAWYFFFEFVILAIFLLGAFLITRLPDTALWCAFTGIGLGILYLIIVIIMDTRGYPTRRQIVEKKDEIE
jgi:hypothetical protein